MNKTARRGWLRDDADAFMHKYEGEIGEAGFVPRLVGGLTTQTGVRKDADIVLDPIMEQSWADAFTAVTDMVTKIGGKVLGAAVQVYGHDAWYLPVELQDGRYAEFILEEKNWPDEFGDAP